MKETPRIAVTVAPAGGWGEVEGGLEGGLDLDDVAGALRPLVLAQADVRAGVTWSGRRARRHFMYKRQPGSRRGPKALSIM